MFGGAITLGLLLSTGTGLALNMSLLFATIISAMIFTYFLYHLHGPYRLKRHERFILGKLRTNKQKKWFIAYCVGFFGIFSIPVIIFLGNSIIQNSMNDKEIITFYSITFCSELAVLMVGNIVAIVKSTES